jgi:hypothetical protein
VSIIEFGKASIIILITGLLYVNDNPKSPLTVLIKNKEYCSKRDLSNPNLFTNKSCCSSVNVVPINAVRGDPGISLNIKKIIVATTHITNSI